MARSPDPNGSDSDDTRLVVTGWQTVNKKPKSTKLVSAVREDTSSANNDDTEDLNDVELATLVSPEEIEENQSHLKVVIETYNEDEIVDCTHEGDVIAEILSKGEEVGLFRVLFEDGHTAEHSLPVLQRLEGGRDALDLFKKTLEARYPDKTVDVDSQSPSDEDSQMSSTRPGSSRVREENFVDIDDALDMADSSDGQGQSRALRKRSRKSSNLSASSSDSDGQSRRSKRLKHHTAAERPRVKLRSAASQSRPVSLPSSDDDSDSYLRSDILPRTRRRPSGPKSRLAGARQSGRSTRHVGRMQDVEMDDDFETQPDKVELPKVKGAAEVFQALSPSDPFRLRHMNICDTCDSGTSLAPLIYCQGCCFAYHKTCLGPRSSREHLVTKVGDDDCVLQCRRCISHHKNKDHTAPDQALCQECHATGESCRPWRTRKTAAQEQKQRDENNGKDPITVVPSGLINNADNILFRCVKCTSAYHFEHMAPKTTIVEDDNVAERRFQEYSTDWQCSLCSDQPAKVGGLVAWRPIEPEIYDPTDTGDQVNEDNKAYLVRWENKSYLRATWMPGPWIWGVTASSMRKAFHRRDDARYPKMTFEEAVPEDFLRPDILLDVRYTSIVQEHIHEVDKARINEVKEALVKYKGLGYEDVVWETPPSSTDQERWSDFVSAYNYWVLGNFVNQPKQTALKVRLEKARAMDFKKLERTVQPDNLVGGELMKYQLKGLNWMLYKWYKQENAILADEMGLGKTIQIVGLLATLVQDWNCFPFLVVVPNSTCANWRREIKKWAPNLRVVAYYGSKQSRDLAYKYELFPGGRREIRCHIVVTSYEAVKDDNCRRFFRSVPWQALIVDEGQRIKNDSSLLYTALDALEVPFKILLTGTPLQNNARELFNLLQFLDPQNLNAAKLEQDFAELTTENIAKLHELIKPFFLRRTKAQVLTFLPPMAQVIVPVSMPTVTKKVYKSILAKSPDLLKAIFAGNKIKASERASLNNILMQLRKCLCHPFVYSQSIEDRNVSHAASHRNLVEASGKLQFLELLLPKLKDRGHRVLIFSQFLDMLNIMEDFLDNLGLKHSRLDGSVSSLVKQKRIDEFNAPDSELFAFLLSTRAGGVGINLATADTVIILDPDFNPHQDIQAISRAHRIGQKKKVTCYQIVTRLGAEEKIMNIGRKKMALDHVLVDKMDSNDAEDEDLESILRHGAKELFEDQEDKDIKFDSAIVDKLIERTEVEETKGTVTEGDEQNKSAESLFSRARVWANDEFEDSLPASRDEEETAPDQNVWDKILQERERIAAAEAAAAEKTFGRGRRKKATVDYLLAGEDNDENGSQPIDAGDKPLKVKRVRNDNDTDFRSSSSYESESDSEHEELNKSEDVAGTGAKDAQKVSRNDHKFTRVNVPVHQSASEAKISGLPTPPPGFDSTVYLVPAPTTAHAQKQPQRILADISEAPANAQILRRCIACSTTHAQGACPLREAGVEFCNLCGTAHFASRATVKICPHLFSETQVRLMMQSLKQSQEPRELVQAATKYLLNCKANLVQKKKADASKAAMRLATAPAGGVSLGMPYPQQSSSAAQPQFYRRQHLPDQQHPFQQHGQLQQHAGQQHHFQQHASQQYPFHQQHHQQQGYPQYAQHQTHQQPQITLHQNLAALRPEWEYDEHGRPRLRAEYQNQVQRNQIPR